MVSVLDLNSIGLKRSWELLKNFSNFFRILSLILKRKLSREISSKSSLRLVIFKNFLVLLCTSLLLELRQRNKENPQRVFFLLRFIKQEKSQKQEDLQCGNCVFEKSLHEKFLRTLRKVITGTCTVEATARSSTEAKKKLKFSRHGPPE